MVEFGKLVRDNDNLVVVTEQSRYILKKSESGFLKLSDNEWININDTEDISDIVKCLITTNHVIIYGNRDILKKLPFHQYGKSTGVNHNGDYIKIYAIM